MRRRYRPRQATERFLNWWQANGIDRIDLAARLASGAWVTHHDHRLPAQRLLAWARLQNLRRADLFLRPARGHSWPHCFLDDIPLPTARCLSHRVLSGIIFTSPAGGCHLHLITHRPCTEAQRADLQRLLAQAHGADRAATAGCQYQRLPGTRNWKRGGTWINLIEVTDHLQAPPPLPVDRLLALTTPAPQQATRRRTVPHEPRSITGRDRSPSGRDWAFVCERLEAGDPPEAILADVIQRAVPRRGADCERYARRTITQARIHTKR